MLPVALHAKEKGQRRSALLWYSNVKTLAVGLSSDGWEGYQGLSLYSPQSMHRTTEHCPAALREDNAHLRTDISLVFQQSGDRLGHVVLRGVMEERGGRVRVNDVVHSHGLDSEGGLGQQSTGGVVVGGHGHGQGHSAGSILQTKQAKGSERGNEQPEGSLQMIGQLGFFVPRETK